MRLVDLLDRKRGYQAMFGARGVLGNAGMTDLVKFCHVFAPVHHEQPQNLLERIEGRREVFMHIMEYLHLEPNDLADLYGITLEEEKGEP